MSCNTIISADVKKKLSLWIDQPWPLQCLSPPQKKKIDFLIISIWVCLKLVIALLDFGATIFEARVSSIFD